MARLSYARLQTQCMQFPTCGGLGSKSSFRSNFPVPSPVPAVLLCSPLSLDDCSPRSPATYVALLPQAPGCSRARILSLLLCPQPLTQWPVRRAPKHTHVVLNFKSLAWNYLPKEMRYYFFGVEVLCFQPTNVCLTHLVSYPGY